MTSRLEYLEHFLDSVDFVCSGKRGSISEDKWLVSNYESPFLSVIEKHLKNADGRVRSETVLLLAALKERAVMDTIKEMRIKDNERVRDACLGYLTSMNEDDVLIPQLMDILEFKRGQEFRNAAVRMGTAGRTSDIPALRRIYGQVDGEMRGAIRETISKLIDKDPDLIKKKDLLLSVPVFPDEKAFIRFLSSAEEYLNVRYMNGAAPKKTISADTYNNIVRGIRKIRVRLFNESANLGYYGERSAKRCDALADILAFVSEDLAAKEIVHNGDIDTVCKKCGAHMLFSGGIWRCIECGQH